MVLLKEYITKHITGI